MFYAKVRRDAGRGSHGILVIALLINILTGIGNLLLFRFSAFKVNLQRYIYNILNFPVAKFMMQNI
jgi:hypothetical protein